MVDTNLVEAFVTLLQKLTPELYTIRQINDKLLKDMEYGEIHIIEYVKEGKVVRVQGSTKTIAQIVDEKF